jgi:hypothetical protein
LGSRPPPEAIAPPLAIFIEKNAGRLYLAR